jgi:hypothetical protein
VSAEPTEIARVSYAVDAVAWRWPDGKVKLRLADANPAREVEVSRHSVLEVDFGGGAAAVGLCPVYALIHDRGRSASVGLDVDTDSARLSPEDLRDHFNHFLGAVAESVDCHLVRARQPDGAYAEVRTHAPFSWAISPTGARLATIAPGTGERVHLWNPLHGAWQGRIEMPGARVVGFDRDDELVIGCEAGVVVRLRYGRAQTWTERSRAVEPVHPVFAERPPEVRSVDGRWRVVAGENTLRCYLTRPSSERIVATGG